MRRSAAAAKLLLLLLEAAGSEEGARGDALRLLLCLLNETGALEFFSSINCEELPESTETMNTELSKSKARTPKGQKLLKHTGKPAGPEQKYIYTCQYCLMKFAQNSHYYRHITANHASQRREATFQCDKCTVVFTKKAALDTHCRTQHKMKSRSRCDSCAVTFKSRYCLRRHMKLKQLLKDNTCPECHKGCADTEALAKHFGSKHVAKNLSHQCDQCVLHFKAERSLTRHVARIHPVKRL